jgi:diacylglycerol kinase
MSIPTTPVHEKVLEALAPDDLAQAASTITNITRAESLPTSSAPSRATFLRSFAHAWAGVMYALRTQRNAQVHLVAAAGALTLGVVLRISALEFALIFLAIMAVLVAELFNTVAEAVVDLVTSEYHPLARVAKDVAAGAVLLCAMFAVVIGLLVFGPHLWPLVTHLVTHVRAR